jgi:hypothetical protein
MWGNCNASNKVDLTCLPMPQAMIFGALADSEKKYYGNIQKSLG